MIAHLTAEAAADSQANSTSSVNSLGMSGQILLDFNTPLKSGTRFKADELFISVIFH